MNINPAKLLPATVQLGTSSAIAFVDDVNSPYNGMPMVYSATLTIDPQAHSSQDTRLPFYYDAEDVQVGNWLGQVGGKAYKIIAVQPIDPYQIQVELEDYDLYVLRSDSNQAFSNAPDEDQKGVIFEIDEEGYPILTGISSQIANFPDLSYWTQDIMGRFEMYIVDEEGIETYADWDQNVVQETEGDGAPTGITIEYTPFQDSKVEVKVNGIVVNLGNGIKTKDCYFSNDGGVTAKLIKDIEAGDELYWNETYAGYRLDPSDDIDFDYEASNLDL